MQLNDPLRVCGVTAFASVFVFLVLPVAADSGRVAGAPAPH